MRPFVRSCLALAALAVALPAVAQDLAFTLTNKSGVAMTELYARPAGASDWEENILGGGTLPSGHDGQVAISGANGCAYDLRIVFADGEVIEDQADLCANPSYTIN